MVLIRTPAWAANRHAQRLIHFAVRNRQRPKVRFFEPIRQVQRPIHFAVRNLQRSKVRFFELPGSGFRVAIVVLREICRVWPRLKSQISSTAFRSAKFAAPKPAEDQSVTVLKGLIKKPETQVSVDSMNPIRATPPDYLAQVAVLAEEVFEDKAVAASWMTTANKALGGKTPVSLCETDIGALHVIRVLRAIEWGGVA